MFSQAHHSTNHPPQPTGRGWNRIQAAVARLDILATRWLARYSLTLLRVSLGLIFLGFGVLKFFPNISPAERLAERTTEALTLGLMPGGVGIFLVAALETAVGLSLVTGKFLRVGLALLTVQMAGILSPLVLFPDDLFSRAYNAPTLEGQYVMKDVLLLTAGLVVAARERGAVKEGVK